MRHIDGARGDRSGECTQHGRESEMSPFMENKETHSTSISQDADSNEPREQTPSTIRGHPPSGPFDGHRDLEDELTGNAAENLPPSSSVLLQASEMFVDSVLQWPIFSKAAPDLAEELHVPIVKVLARPAKHATSSNETPTNIGSTLLHLNSDMLNDLITNFLENNHIKNPILDVQTLYNDASEFAESGPKWDGKSCLIVSLSTDASVA